MSSARSTEQGRHSLDRRTAGSRTSPAPDPETRPVGSLPLGTPVARRHRHRSTASSRQVRPGPVVGLAVVVAASVLAALIITHRHHGSSVVARDGSSAPAASRTSGITDVPAPLVPLVPSLITWARANLSTAAVIVSDAQTAAALQKAGFRAATSFADSATADAETLDYVLAVQGAPVSAQQTKLLAMSLPLAVFGDGDGASTLRQVFPGGADAARTAQARDLALRTAGGRQLSQNPALTIDASTRAALDAGRLDLRAQNVVNVLAADGTVWLSIDAEQTVESRAGLPSRVVTLTTAAPAAAQVTLASLSPPYKPSAITTVGPAKFRLTWTPQIAPVATVGG